jgi:hypothetical protein
VRALLDASGDDLARLVRPVRSWVSGGDSDEAGLDVFARAAWSGIAEPGDVVAGLARRGLGPAVALRLAVESVVERGGGGAGRGLETALRDSPAGDDLGRFSVDAALRRWAPRLQRWRAEASLRAAEALDIRLLVPGDPGWPAELAELGDHAPAVLWLRGAGELPAPAASVAVVGARAATSYGETVAADLGSGLSDRGLTVVSGGAYGIDGSAHRAALASEAPTVAVMAGGADRFYPAGHDELLRRVVQAGLLVAEAPCGTTPSRWRFLQRKVQSMRWPRSCQRGRHSVRDDAVDEYVEVEVAERVSYDGGELGGDGVDEVVHDDSFGLLGNNNVGRLLSNVNPSRVCRMDEKSRGGRPPAQDPLGKVRGVRFTEAEASEIDAAVARLGVKAARFIREAALEKARQN